MSTELNDESDWLQVGLIEEDQYKQYEFSVA